MIGIHPILTVTKTKIDIFATIRSSVSDGFCLILGHKSTVRMIDEELNMEVNDDSKAAIRTAIIKPRAPV